ncbi:hypothetical protein MKX57_09310 [Lysinibacillus sp. FSL M8-0216]|uniref:hypothetical protein n=1 Tax=Lysinibacillus sp. FSL M8-0216 TaxID=2921619 RepID=UPI00315B032B
MENPALKLHSLLEQAFDISKDYSSFNYIWSIVFDIDENDTPALMITYSSMLNLLLDTKSYISQDNKLNTERNIKFITNIENALGSIDFGGQMSSFRSHLSAETLTAFYYIAESINYRNEFNDKPIDEPAINEIIKDVDNLIEGVLVSPLPEEVKKLLLKNLTLIKASLQNYKISGYEGIQDAFDQTIGAVFRNNEILINNKDENIKGLFNIIDKLNSLLSTGVAFKDLLGPIFGLLLK